VAEGKNPLAERAAERSHGTFAELALAYRDRYAKKHNKSWKQAATLVDRYLLPRWGKMPAANLSRADVRALMDAIAAPVLANQVVASASAIFNWGAKQDLVVINPCRGVDLNSTSSRERVLSDSEIAVFWKAFDDAGLICSAALKTILLTGQRPGEIAHMRYEHIKDGWWTMPGQPDRKLGWPGTKNAATHRVWLSKAVQAVIGELAADDTSSGWVFANSRNRPIRGLDVAMREICSRLGIDDKVTPHDCRRTFSSRVTGLGFGREALNRVTNHREGGIADVYDRHQYGDENKQIMETVADHLLLLAEGGQVVVIGKFGT
jgi:integrase